MVNVRTRYCFIILALLAGLALLAPLLETLTAASATSADISQRFLPASMAHIMGTDELGRDVFLRLLYGGRVSLCVAAVGAFFSAMIGTVVGLVAGYAGYRTDAFLMRLADIVIALPLLPLLIILAALDPAKIGLPALGSLERIILIVSLFGWPAIARLVRAGTLTAKEQTYVTAAIALGLTPARVLTRHILPNILSPVIVATTLACGGIILLESVLSFLGLGIQPPASSWGNMLANAQDIIWDRPMLAVWPGLMIFTTVICLNLAGDALYEAADPRASPKTSAGVTL